jgi:hypothetical protein
MRILRRVWRGLRSGLGRIGFRFMNSSPENQSSVDGIRTALIAALASVVVGAITVGFQYFVTYREIELPKIELESRRIALEEKKVAIDAQKLAVGLTPNIETSCSAARQNAWTWFISCTNKNSGAYHVDVDISEVKVSINSETAEPMYESGNGFDVEFPQKKTGFRAAPNSDGLLWFYVKFDKQKYRDGINRSDMSARVYFTFATIDSARSYVMKTFPEVSSVVSDSIIRRSRQHVSLPILINPR